MKKKLIRITQLIFAYGMGVLMTAAFIVAICYVVAFIVGLPASEAICGFLDTYVLPCVYVSGIGLCALGVLNMYLRGEHVFLLNISPHKNAGSNQE